MAAARSALALAGNNDGAALRVLRNSCGGAENSNKMAGVGLPSRRLGGGAQFSCSCKRARVSAMDRGQLQARPLGWHGLHACRLSPAWLWPAPHRGEEGSNLPLEGLG